MVIIAGACAMLLSGIFGKVGAMLASIPTPVIGGMFLVMFGVITAVGISNLQVTAVRALFHPQGGDSGFKSGSYQAEADITLLQQMQTFVLEVPWVKMRARTQKGSIAEGSLVEAGQAGTGGSRITKVPSSTKVAVFTSEHVSCSVYI